MLTLLCVHNVIYILIVELKATLKKLKSSSYENTVQLIHVSNLFNVYERGNMI